MNRDVLVLGRSLTSLLAALDLAEVGLTVTVAGGATELPDGGERDPRGALSAAMERIASPIEGTAAAVDEGSLPVKTPTPTAWLLDEAGEWAPQADPSVWGIPSVALSAETARLIGSRAAIRAHMDRIMPLLTIRKTRSLGELVRRRLGDAVLDRLTEPLIRERYGVPAGEVDAAIAAPGLSPALARTGALTSAAAAYAERNVARETTVAPAGGWPHFAGALVRRLEAYGVELVDGLVVGVEPRSGHGSERGAEDGWSAEFEGGTHLHARALVLDPGAWRDGADIDDALSARVTDLMPTRERAHADIDIQPVPGLAPAGDRIAAVRSLGDWSLRITALEDRADGDEAADGGSASRARWCAELSGPAVAAGSRQEAVGERLEELLADAGLAPELDAGWRTRRVAAPFRTVAERDRAAAAVTAALADRPGLVPIGRILHGDDLAAALGAAHDASVALRRELLGLAE